MARHPCRSCGACCASFRVSFYWADSAARALPESLTTRVTPFRAAMLGTEREPPRCAALAGEVGRRTDCTVYEARPTPCREFEPSWEFGEANDACDRARARHGLPPLRPESWGRSRERQS